MLLQKPLTLTTRCATHAAPGRAVRQVSSDVHELDPLHMPSVSWPFILMWDAQHPVKAQACGPELSAVRATTAVHLLHGIPGMECQPQCSPRPAPHAKLLKGNYFSCALKSLL